jgi:hypothetical protein
MKLIIAGGRDYFLSQDDIQFLDDLHAWRETKVTEVVCGMCSGADYGGRLWALCRNIPVKEFPADWTSYGRSAGPYRNREMARYADACVLFPGGAGTDSMERQAKAHGLIVFDRRHKV